MIKTLVHQPFCWWHIINIPTCHAFITDKKSPFLVKPHWNPHEIRVCFSFFIDCHRPAGRAVQGENPTPAEVMEFRWVFLVAFRWFPVGKMDEHGGFAIKKKGFFMGNRGRNSNSCCSQRPNFQEVYETLTVFRWVADWLDFPTGTCHLSQHHPSPPHRSNTGAEMSLKSTPGRGATGS